MQLSAIHTILRTKLAGISGELTLNLNDIDDALFQKTIRAAGVSNGYCLQITNPSLGDINETDNTFTLTGASCKLVKMGATPATAMKLIKSFRSNTRTDAQNQVAVNDFDTNIPSPYEGYGLSLTGIGYDEEDSCDFEIRLIQPKDTKHSLLSAFPNLIPMRVIDSGVMVKTESPIGEIYMRNMVYSYSTEETDLAKESEEDSYPQPMYVTGELSLADTVLKREHPYLPDIMQIMGSDYENPSMLRFFAQNNPAFKFFARIKDNLFDFMDVLIKIKGFGLYLTNLAPDPYATFDQEKTTSEALLFIDAALCSSSQNIDMYLYTNIFQNSGFWNFKAVFTNGVSINQGIGFLFDVFSIPVKTDDLPGDIWLLNKLLLREIGVTINRTGGDRLTLGQSLELVNITILVSSSERWVTPVPFLAFDNVGVALEFYKSGEGFSLHGNLFTDFVFAENPNQPDNPVTFRTIVSLPYLDIRAWLVSEVDLPLADALAKYIGTQPVGLPTDLKLANAWFEGSWADRSLSAGFQVTGHWGLSIGNNTFSLEEIEAGFSASQNAFVANVSGAVALTTKDNTNEAILYLSAKYDGNDQAWLFSGGMNGTLEVFDFVANFFGTPPAWLEDYAPKITIREFSFAYSTAQGNPMSVQGRLDAKIPLKFLGTSFNVDTRARIERKLGADGKTMVLTGDVAGLVTMGKFGIMVSASFAEQTQSYVFKILIDNAYVMATLSKANGHDVLKISLGNMTVGGIIQFFGKLVNPNYDFKLEQPWNVLGDINLSGAELVYDSYDKTIAFTYALNCNIGIADIKLIGFKYNWGKEQRGFDIILTGNFLGQEYTEGRPLSWDVMNTPPPSTVPTNDKFTLDFFGIGQHVTFEGYNQKNVADVLAAMKKAMQPVKDAKDNPFKSTSLSFDKNTGLILGFDAKIAGFITLKAVLKNPDLYGGSIVLGGDGAGSLAGLSFELFYTTSNGIGCFSVEFTVPYIFRKLQLGAVTINMGKIKVSIYTNGGFMVDLGFPHNMNFNDSFGIEVFPFLGSGGAYFGVLYNVAYDKLPSTNYGTFSPIVAFGLGFRVGVGKSFDAGILSASASLTFLAVIEGVLAWFHHNTTAKTQPYYYLSGTVGISGSVWGKVDFKVIAVKIGVDIMTTAAIVMRSSEPTLIAFKVNVEAYASIKIFFVTIPFSYKMNVSFDFTIGKSSSALWKMQPGAINAPVSSESLSRRRRVASATGTSPNYQYDFATIQRGVPANNQKVIQLWLTPFFTVDNIDVTVSLKRLAEPTKYRIAFLLALGDLVKPEDIRDSSLGILISAFLHLNIKALGCSGDGDSLITLADLKSFAAFLRDVKTAYASFTVGNIEQVFNNNQIIFKLKAAEDTDVTVSAAAFPMPPVLTGEFKTFGGASATEKRNYADYGAVDEDYLDWLTELYEHFYHTNAVRTMKNNTGQSSMAEHIFRGYFYMLSRVIVEKSIDEMENTSYSFADGDTLRDVCHVFPQIKEHYLYKDGDGLENIAELFGLYLDELLFLNPGLDEEIKTWEYGKEYVICRGLTPQSVLPKNTDWPLKNGVTLCFDAFPCTIHGGDTLKSIVSSVNGDLQGTIESNLYTEGLLAENPGVTLSGYTCELPHSMLGDIWAAVFYTRIFRPDLPEASWYYEAICALNPGSADQLGKEIHIPASYGNTNPENIIKWTVLRGDTSQYIAAYCALYQNPELYPLFIAFRDAVRKENYVSESNTFMLPKDTIVRPLYKESLNDLADRLLFREGHSRISDIETYLAESTQLLRSTRVLQVTKARILTVNETVKAFSDKYRIPISKLAGLIQELPVLTQRNIQLPVLYGIQYTKLQDALLREDHYQSINGLLSRFMLNGQVVPEKFEDGKPVHLMGLYQRTGQQFDSCVPEKTPAVLHTFTLTKNDERPWLTLESGGVTMSFTGQMLDNHYPDTVLHQIYKSRGQLPVVENYNLQYPISQVIPWENEVMCQNEAMEDDESGSWQIAVFSESMRYLNDEAMTLMRHSTQSGLATEVNNYTWAALLSLDIKRLETENAFEVCSASPESAAILEKLYLNGTCTDILILYPDRTSGHMELVSEILDRDKTMLIKLNLSTEAKDNFKLRMAYQPEYYAPIKNAKDFIKLLWQCDNVGGHGFYLYYSTADGCGLPIDMFSDIGEGRLYFMAIDREASTVKGYHNCAIVQDYFDLSSEIIYAVGNGDDTRQAVYMSKPGTAAYELILDNPTDTQVSTAADEKQLYLRQLYNLASFTIEEEPFKKLESYLPIAPQSLERSRDIDGVTVEGNDVWRYMIELRLAQVTDYSKAPDIAMYGIKVLPIQAADPYRSIAYAYAHKWQDPYTLTVKTVWHDLLGNRSKSEPALSVEYGYADKLVPILSYISTEVSYIIDTVSASPDTAGIFFALYFKAHDYMPDMESVVRQEEIAGVLEEFEKIYYQIIQADIALYAEMTITNRVELPVYRLRSYVYAVYSYLQMLQCASAVKAEFTTLKALCDKYGVSLKGLANVNAGLSLYEIFAGGSVVLPDLRRFGENNTLDRLFEGASTRLLEDDYNKTLFLKEDIFLKTDPYTKTYKSEADGASLEEAAEALGIPVEYLASANVNATGIFADKIRLSYNGFEVEAAASDSFSSLAGQFNKLEVSVTGEELALFYKTSPILKKEWTWSIDVFRVNPKTTMADAASGRCTIEYLIALNKDTENIYDADEVIKTGNITKYNGQIDIMAMTLSEVAALIDTPPEMILLLNQSAAINHRSLTLPAHIALPDTFATAYFIPSVRSLKSIADIFAETSSALARDNLNTPAVIKGKVSISVKGKSATTPEGGCSIQEALDLFTGITLADLVAAIETRTDCLNDMSVLFCPPAIVGSQSLSIKEFAAKYSIDTYSLVFANISVANILADGVSVSVTRNGISKTVTTSQYHTFAVLPHLFENAGLQVTLDEIIQQNVDKKLLKSNARLLLPAEITINGAFAKNSVRFPEEAFILKAELILTRKKECMHSELADSDAATAKCEVAVLNDRLPEFTQKLQNAFPGVWVNQGGHDDSGIWLVVFDQNNIEEIKVRACALAANIIAPFYYALRPLSRSLLSCIKVQLWKLTNQAKLEAGDYASFEGIDIETWAADFIEDLECLLSPDILSFLAEKLPEYIDLLISLKQRLAQTIAMGIHPILLPITGDYELDKRTSAAAEQLTQILLKSLHAGYNQNVIAQYDVSAKQHKDCLHNLMGSAFFNETGQEAPFNVLGGRIPIMNSPSPYYAHFVINANDSYKYAQVDLNALEYRLSGFEANVTKTTEDYELSTYVTPVADEMPQAITVDLSTPVPAPLVLREYPVDPVLLNNGFEIGKSYSDILNWDAVYTYEAPVAVQDLFILKIICNADRLTNRRLIRQTDLFTALAAYNSVSQELIQLLLNVQADTSVEIYQNALDTYLELADTVENGWKKRWVPVARLGFTPEAIAFTYEQRVVFEKDSTTPQFVLIKERTSDTAYDLGFPEISCGLNDQEIFLLSCTVSDNRAKYGFTEDPAIDWSKTKSLRFIYRFKAIDGVRVVNTKAVANAKRNANLPVCDVDISGILKVNNEFVYTMPTIEQQDATEPLLRVNSEIDGGTWTIGTANPLNSFFNRLVDGMIIDCVIRYSYQNGDYRASLPVAGFINIAFNKITTLNTIIKAVTDWKAEVAPSAQAGKWHFSLRVYRTGEGVNDKVVLASYENVCLKS